MSGYRARRYEHSEPDEPPEDNADPPDLRTHTGLDAAAAAAGHTWTSDDLNASQKRDELANLNQ